MRALLEENKSVLTTHEEELKKCRTRIDSLKEENHTLEQKARHKENKSKIVSAANKQLIDELGVPTQWRT